MDPKSQREMIGISVDTNKFVHVLQSLNNKLKEQDQRLTAFEAMLGTCVKVTQYETDLNETREAHKQNSLRIDAVNQRLTEFADEYDGKLKEVIVSNSIAIKTVQDGLTSYIEQVAHQVTELREGGVTPNSTDNSFHADVKRLKQSLGLVDSLEPTDEERARVARGMTPEEHLRILTDIRVNKVNIARLAEELSRLKEGGSISPTVGADSIPTDPEEEDFEAGTDSEVLKKMARRVGALSSKLNKVIIRLDNNDKAGEKRNEDQRKIIYGVIDELRLLHGHADGMNDIPIQDFGSVAPSYFGEDPDWERKSAVYSLSFPGKRPSVCNSARATWRAPDLEQPEQGSGRQAGKDGSIVIVQNPSSSKVSTEVTSAAVPSRMPSRLSTTTSVVAEIESQGPDPSLFVGGEPVTSAMVRDLRFMLGCFNRDKDKLMAAIDRKVDRDMVERLFNKFRVMIVQINDRVNEMATLTEKFASQKDVDTMATVIKNIPGFKDNPTLRMSLDMTGHGGISPMDSVVRRSGGMVGKMTLPPLQDPPE